MTDQQQYKALGIAGNTVLKTPNLDRLAKQGVYFKNVPITIEVFPKHDYKFIGWEGRKETSKKITINPKGDILLKPLFEVKHRSPFMDSLIINEICFYQIEGDTSRDWIESSGFLN